MSAAKTASVRCIAVPNAITRIASFHDADLVLPSLDDRSLADVLRHFS